MLENVKQIREGAEVFQKLADTYKEFADLMEDEDLSEEELERNIEMVMGRIMMLSLKARSITD